MSQITLEVAKLPTVRIATKRVGTADVYRSTQALIQQLRQGGRDQSKIEASQLQLGWIILAAALIDVKMESKIQSLQERLSETDDNNSGSPVVKELRQAMASKESHISKLAAGLQSSLDKLFSPLAERRSQLLKQREELFREAQQLLDRLPETPIHVALSKDRKGLDALTRVVVSLSNVRLELQVLKSKYRAFSEKYKAISEPIRNLLASHPEALTTQGQAITEAFDRLITIEKQFQSCLRMGEKLVQSQFDVEDWMLGNLQQRPKLVETIDPDEATADRQFAHLATLMESARRVVIDHLESSSLQTNLAAGDRISPISTALTILPQELTDTVSQAAGVISTHLDSLSKEVHQVVENIGDLSQLTERARRCTAAELPFLVDELESVVAPAWQKLDQLLVKKGWLEMQEVVKETGRLLTSWLSQVNGNVASDPVLERTWLIVGHLNDWFSETGHLWTITGMVKGVYDQFCKVESTLLQTTNEISAAQKAKEAAVEKAKGRLDAFKGAQKSIERSLETCANGIAAWAYEDDNEAIAAVDQATFDLETTSRSQTLLEAHPTLQTDSTGGPDVIHYAREIGAFFLSRCHVAKTNSFATTTVWKLLPRLASHAEGLFLAAKVTYEFDFTKQSPIRVSYVH